MKLSANFLNSVSLTSLSAFAFVLRACAAFMRCWFANVLNSFKTSRSTVEVALGAPSFAWGGIGLMAAADGFNWMEFWFDGLDSVALGWESVLVSGFVFEVLEIGGVAEASFLEAARAFASSTLAAAWPFGFLSWDDIMAGSTGAPLTVAEPVGARRAGGVYLFSRLPGRGGKSCRLTPLYLLERSGYVVTN